MLANGYKVPKSCHIEDVFHLEYYFMDYSSHTIGFYFYAQDVCFKELELGEVVNVEAVLDTKTVVVDTEPQRHMDMGSMAWDPYELEIRYELLP